MKTAAVLKPAMLFAAGTVATTAHAAPTVDTTVYTAASDGTVTDITIGGASAAQYSFAKDPFPGSADYVVTGLGNAQITATSQANPYFPAIGNPQFGSSATTGNGFKNQEFPPSATDQYFGLKFDINKDTYLGYAKVNGAGDTISEIGYQAASAVPEPAAWAMMIAGFGVVGAAARRRRQAPAAAIA